MLKNNKLKHIMDRRLLAPLMLIVFFEIFFQSGVYNSLQHPGSAGGLIFALRNRLKVEKKNPQYLIMGTSVARQAVNLNALNEQLNRENKAVQSIAYDGSSLIVQNLLYRETREQFKGVNKIIHILEPPFPLSARHDIKLPHRYQMSHFNKADLVELVQTYNYDVVTADIFYFGSGLVRYRADFRNFILNPFYRLEQLEKIRARQLKISKPEYYPDNHVNYSLATYPAENLRECINKSELKRPEYNSKGIRQTDERHRKTINNSCRLYLILGNLSEEQKKRYSKLFFQRLKLFYREVAEDGKEIFLILSPISRLLSMYTEKSYIELWERHVREISGGNQVKLLDLSAYFSARDQNHYFADPIHLNSMGAKKITELLKDIIQ